MREILFRGKRLKIEDWVEGSLIVYPDGDCYIARPSDNPCVLDKFNIDPSTVGQYTGLTDKNGRKIFEGDIIQIRFEGDAEPLSTPPVWYETGKVIWHEQLHGWYVVFDSPDGIPIQEYDDCDDVVVIGNIHDNPELLEV